MYSTHSFHKNIPQSYNLQGQTSAPTYWKEHQDYVDLPEPQFQNFLIFIGCLHGKTNEQLVEAYFSQFGPIYNIRLRKKGQGGSAGFGTFSVSSYEQFRRIIDQDHFLLGRKIICREYLLGNQKEAFLKDLNQRRVFIRNVPPEFSDLDIRAIFSRFGNVNKAYAIRDEFGNSRGFGYVCFEHVREANQVIQQRMLKVLGRHLIECLPYDKTPHQGFVACQESEKFSINQQREYQSHFQTGNALFQANLIHQAVQSTHTTNSHQINVCGVTGPQTAGYLGSSTIAKEFTSNKKTNKLLKSSLPLEFSKLINLNSRGNNIQFNKQNPKTRKNYLSRLESLLESLKISGF